MLPAVLCGIVLRTQCMLLMQMLSGGRPLPCSRPACVARSGDKGSMSKEGTCGIAEK